MIDRVALPRTWNGLKIDINQCVRVYDRCKCVQPLKECEGGWWNGCSYG